MGFGGLAHLGDSIVKFSLFDERKLSPGFLIKIFVARLRFLEYFYGHGMRVFYFEFDCEALRGAWKLFRMKLETSSSGLNFIGTRTKHCNSSILFIN